MSTTEAARSVRTRKCHSAHAATPRGNGSHRYGVVLVALSLALVLAFLAASAAAQSEPTVGVTGGLTFAGDQDITITDRNGSARRSNDVGATIGPVGGVTSALWWSHIGLQVDALYWGTSAKAVLPGSAQRVDVTQDRGAVLMSLMGRLRLQPEGPFGYVGLGGGFAVIGVDPGQTSLQPAVNILAGMAIPLTRHLRIRTEVRYLLTHDSDPKTGRGISTEVSGGRGANAGRAVLGPHFDTQFVPLLIGLDYVF